MDDLNISVKLKGKSGRTYTFIHRYDFSNSEEPKTSGIYIFINNQSGERPNIIDIQFLSANGDLSDTTQRMKEDGALYAFVIESNNELQSDLDIDDIKAGEDFRSRVE